VHLRFFKDGGHRNHESNCPGHRHACRCRHDARQLLPMNTCMEEKSELFPSKTSAQIAALCELLLLG
jgi:hypothetical protein